jgi:hypothetical protein
MWQTLIALWLGLSDLGLPKSPRRRRPAFRRPLLEELEDRTVLSPLLTAANLAVSGSNGAVVGNSGTFSDSTAGASVTLTASAGTVVQNNGTGTWSWSETTPAGPPQTAPVTIYATDSQGGRAATEFWLNVGQVLTVTNTGDNNGVDPAAGAGTGTLRQALVDADNAPAAGGLSLITFAIPTSDSGYNSTTGGFTITVQAALRQITNPVAIDGFTQSGSVPNNLPLKGTNAGDNAVQSITVDGSHVGGDGGLILTGGSSTVRGLAIQNFGAGIHVTENGNDTIEGNSIDCYTGILISGASCNTVGGDSADARNVISPFTTVGWARGIEIEDFNAGGTTAPASNNQVLGNYIGPNADGSTTNGTTFQSTNPAGNGVWLLSSYPNAPVANNTIGGTSPLEGNIISGWEYDLTIQGVGTQENLVEGNYIGTNAAGSEALPPQGGYQVGVGVDLLGSGNNTIGGLAQGSGNLISGLVGAILVNPDCPGNKVQGNFIGTNSSGTQSIPNDVGVGGGDGAVIEGNVISGNLSIGLVAGPGSTVQGNLIGTDITGTEPLSNGVGVVPDINSIIGGTAPDEGNTIAFNNGPGVWVQGDSNPNSQTYGSPADNIPFVTGAQIENNSMHDNGGLSNTGLKNDALGNDGPGIDLGDIPDLDDIPFDPNRTPRPEDAYNDVFPNTTTNPNTPFMLGDGPNDLQNFPVLASASSSATGTTITGTLSNTVPGDTFRLEFFSNTRPDPSGFFEGQTFLGSAQVTTDPTTGNASFTVTLPTPVLAGQGYLTATATDVTPGAPTYGDTSEFSGDLNVPDASLAPVTGPNLQALINNVTPAGAARTVIFQASDSTTADMILGAVNGLAPQSSPTNVVLNLGSGTYTDVNASPPAGVTLIITGNGSTTTIVGQSPALTVASGNVVVTGVTLTTATDAPTVLVTGGSVTLRNDVIQESTGFADAAIAVTGGTLDLGTTSDPGNNTINVNGPGQLLLNTTPNAIPAAGNAFESNGTPLAAPTLSFTALTASASSDFGQAVTFTASVRPDGSGATPTGSVDFFDTTTNTDLGSVALSGGSAALTTTTLPVGSQTITASYGGDANYLPSSASASLAVLESIYLLNSTAGGELSVSGNAGLNVAGLVQVDSKSPTAVQASGNAKVTASAIRVVGGVQSVGNAGFSVAPVTGAASVFDPERNLPAPTGGTSQGSVNLAGNSSLTINPGVYSSIKVSGNARLTLNPGVYVIAGGGFTVSGNASVTGTGVMIYNAGSNYTTTGSGGTFGGITLSSGGAISLAAPTSGPYAGIVLFQECDNNRAISLSGNGVTGLGGGLVYAPQALLTVSGNAQLQHAPLIVSQLQLSGNGTSTLTDGSDGTNNTVGQLLAGDLAIYVDNTSGSFTPDELSAIQYAVTNTDALLAPYGVSVSEVSDPSQANLTIDSNTTSAVGGMAQGVLGCFNLGTSEVTLIQGWDWYAGSDPSAIGASQYSFETTVTHELGHALGLGGSNDPTSPMYESLPTGVAKGGLTAADLALPPLDTTYADALHAAGFAANLPAGAGTAAGPFTVAAPAPGAAGLRGCAPAVSAPAAPFAPPTANAGADASLLQGAAGKNPDPAGEAPGAPVVAAGLPAGAGGAVGAAAGFGSGTVSGAARQSGLAELDGPADDLPTFFPAEAASADRVGGALQGYLLPGAGTAAVDALMAQLGRGASRSSNSLAPLVPPIGETAAVRAGAAPDRLFLVEGPGGALAACSLLALQGAAEAGRKRPALNLEAGRPITLRRGTGA